jgi:hypothetical protein
MSERSREETLRREGWKRQFVACEPRLSEALEIYREAGFEVHLEPLPKQAECESCAGAEGVKECRVCFEGLEDRYRVIFTRRKRRREGPESDDERF